MKKIFFSLASLVSLALMAQTRDYPIQAVDFTKVKLNDQFWLPRLKLNHTVTIPASFERCENTGRVKNFEMAAQRSGKFCTKFPFDDTDIYKTIEGASYSLRIFPDKKLEAYIDSLIYIIGKAQEPDGYLYTSRTIDPLHPHPWSGMQRWEKERESSHELYNAGHLYEAAAAHYFATGKRTLLNIALKNADLVCSVFGPGKRHIAPGHEIVEMGLVKLYRITGKKEYLETAKDFVDARGNYDGYDQKSHDPWRNGSYWQDDKPVVDQDEAEGHAVRAGYLYSGVADIAALTGEEKYIHAIDSIWENMVSKKIYVNGGIGAVPNGERYGADYELPNATAYNETCASIATVFWAYRMFLLHGDSKYMDVLEKILYNSLISGIGLDGKSFFYSNALQVKNSFNHPSLETSRAGWFECSCCPTNLVRLLPSVPGYVYAQKDDAVYMNLFMSSSASLLVQGKEVNITQQNDYPWSGNLKFIINPKSTAKFSLKLRIPGWSRNEAIPSDLYSFIQPIILKRNDPVSSGNPNISVSDDASTPKILVNGQPVVISLEHGYAVIKRNWKKNDLVELVLPMDVKKIVANPALKDDRGKIALQRGPLVYCMEGIDNGGKASNILIPENANFTFRVMPDLLNGVTVIQSLLPVVLVDEQGEKVSTQNMKVTAIPYYAWANRGESEMVIWFPKHVKDIDLLTTDALDKNNYSK
ncbi:MAG: glycoside hydrolase family 127 protein [Flavisolibacter sp.]